MIRTLMATTALTVALSSGALAQNAVPMAPNNAMTEMSPRAFDMNMGYTYADTDSLATRIIGQPLYGSTAADADNFGDVTDLVIGQDGSVTAVIVGVGGFLGIGQKQVAVDFHDLQFTVAGDQTERWVINTTREALENAPSFEWVEDDVRAPGNAMAPAPMNQAPMNQAPANQAQAPMAPAPMAPAPMAPANQAPMTPAPMAPADQPAATPAPMAPGAADTMFDRSTLADFDATTLTAEELRGTAVYDVTDDRVGEIGDFVLNEAGAVDAVIIDVGGFLGLGQKPVAVAFEDLAFYTDSSNNRYLVINSTREQLEAQPRFDRDTYTMQRDTQRMIVRP